MTYEEWFNKEGFGVLKEEQIFQVLREIREGDTNTARDMLGYMLMVEYLQPALKKDDIRQDKRK